jgi:hypothetical protein
VVRLGVKCGVGFRLVDTWGCVRLGVALELDDYYGDMIGYIVARMV